MKIRIHVAGIIIMVTVDIILRRLLLDHHHLPQLFHCVHVRMMTVIVVVAVAHFFSKFSLLRFFICPLFSFLLFTFFVETSM